LIKGKGKDIYRSASFRNYLIKKKETKAITQKNNFVKWREIILMSILIFFLAGALGALVKDLIEDNTLELPKKINGRFSFGFLGGMVIGGAAGYLVDQNPTTAFLSGYAGTSVIENLITPQILGVKAEPKSIEEIIRTVTAAEKVDSDLAVRVARCESNLDPKAVNTNKDGSKDRGIFQINNKWHPQVSDEDAFDPVKATLFFCERVKAGFLSDWNTTRKCWEK